ncbi:hypothetical protein [Anaerofustis stercorihominis]|uniref:hypothetical protein n=1 Tax=Anaerofustis stercorihominis TaxID=214853 RepID=UPI002672C334|nr:hypothetical protein [Anaerofustis stercorihominis]
MNKLKEIEISQNCSLFLYDKCKDCNKFEIDIDKISCNYAGEKIMKSSLSCSNLEICEYLESKYNK